MLQKLPENSASIMIAPPLSGGKEFIYQYMLNILKNQEPVLFITTDKSPEEIKRDLIKNKLFYGHYENKGILKFIDCYSSQTNNKVMPNTEHIKRISGPLALNEISIALSEIERDFLRKNPNHGVIFSSLSTILMYSNAQAVGRFLQILIAKIKKAGGSVLFALEGGMHDEKTVITIEHLMDVIINVKKEKGKILFMAKGISGFDDWTIL